MKLSIIIPFVGEHPQVQFTIQTIAQQFIDRCDFEILAVDNYIEGDKRISSKNDSGPAIEACQRGHEWLRYVKFTDALSHWQAKRYGVLKSTGDVFLFVDAHVVPSRDALYNMYQTYLKPEYIQTGSMHIPVTYKILEWRRLIYKMLVEHDCFYDYRFTPMRYQGDDPFEVPCMSACGVMMSKEIYHDIGGWPGSLTIYGGGENFLNYTLAVIGKKKWIFPNGTLYHHGSNRDYHYEYDGFVYNRLLAHYLFGGKSLLERVSKVIKGNKNAVQKIRETVVPIGIKQREHIKVSQVISIEDWRKDWL